MQTTDRRITLRFMAAPTDVATLGGGVRGGRILEWVDKAAYACAAAWSGGYSVTAYVGNISFGRDIASGDVVEVTATLVHTGRSSMHIECRVASADPRRGQFTEASRCMLVFVAVDDEGRPTAVRQWHPSSPEDVARSDHAARRTRVRERITAAMSTADYEAPSTAPEASTRFLAAPTDVNWGGNTHGGRVMGWIDDVAYLCGTQWCRGEAVTVYMGGVRFYEPIRIGQVVETSARLIHTGRQTMHVSVHVYAYWPRDGRRDRRLTAHSLTVLAALDEHGDATATPEWIPKLPGDVALDAHARELIVIRGQRRPAREHRMVEI
ncbi:acyl-CoA thioesterase [Gordonia neofelifaecis]|uniref:4-hydroxybenzoyl-CoA thioesterase n=1 Tax=Gordonia neofelifaecis NRRL B-59395 TaxID=644548 RepID=F1YHV8_9ACTN|nr:hotdog domain-containing protein [Gordonia neofelifaecis]EGD55512.1 4-hydroxybenzoyl-CoA thioesterase [Gordonia neofelifaecis NRRL B-59395]